MRGVHSLFFAFCSRRPKRRGKRKTGTAGTSRKKPRALLGAAYLASDVEPWGLKKPSTPRAEAERTSNVVAVFMMVIICRGVL